VTGTVPAVPDDVFLPDADPAELDVALREALLVGEALRFGESGHVATWSALTSALRTRTHQAVPTEARELVEAAASEEVSSLVQSLARRPYSSAPVVWKQVSATLQAIRRRRR
jgi:hypothetical protein